MSTFDLFHPTPSRDLMGWGDIDRPMVTTEEKHKTERSFFDTFAQDYPRGYSAGPLTTITPERLKLFTDLMEANNLDPRSRDLTVATKWLFGKRAWWLPQLTGSCVWSNTWRRIVDKMILQIALEGEPSEYFGSTVFSPKSIAPYILSYGMARQRAKMRSGDGLYASPMAESLLKDGFLLSSNTKLKEILNSQGETGEQSYPEPRNVNVYRQFQNWKYNDTLREYCDFRVLECDKVTTVDQMIKNLQEFKPMYMCSSIAIKATGKDKDGFTIHDQNTGDRWDHNMGIGGLIVNSQGNLFGKITNDSWVYPNDTDPDRYNYQVPVERMGAWFKRGALDVYTIGRIDLPKPVPLT